MKRGHVVDLLWFAAVASAVGLPVARISAEVFQWRTATPESQDMSSRKLDALKETLAAEKTAASP